uniref:Uncharacterized protein n=1 Tax=Candidatus Kentrum sp. SD TaxID=2126332 RepID=A0A450YZ22_9GAMM|nr:MAG: hypothetical protein BECKSD772F_GA0070984_108212 [Candidatus Kentron sp. SD]VFK46776.1 MAG: hypothetical protein BECKSD772E_GA0070983_108012 [Candidatus Kentron sp. SD]
MSKLDLAREKIAYLKFWLAIMVAVEVTMTGWLLTNIQSAHWLLILADVLAIIIIGFGGYTIHTRIEAQIARTEEL